MSGNLDQNLIRYWGNSLDTSGLGANNLSSAGELRISLQGNFYSSLTGVGLGNLVALKSIKEISTALGVADVFDSDVHPLLDDTTVHLLVDLDSNSVGGNVVDNTSTTMVILVRHTGLDGSVGLDVDVVTELEEPHVVGHVEDSLLSEGTSE